MRRGSCFALAAASLRALGCAGAPDPPVTAVARPSPPLSATPAPAAPDPPSSSRVARTVVPRVIGRSPHDRGAFTQGLLLSGGSFLESTGRYGESSLRRVDVASGRVLTKVDLPANVFAEGLAALGGELFQLTWQSGVCFVYDEPTFAKRRELRYDGEGWGLTSDGEGHLVMSDGSATLRFRDPKTFGVVREIEVHDASGPVTRLNELEWVKGEVLANVWLTRMIVRVDPSNGEVTGYLDLAGLPEPNDDEDAVLNGIAYDPAADRLFVTGKLWTTVFEISIRPRARP